VAPFDLTTLTMPFTHLVGAVLGQAWVNPILPLQCLATASTAYFLLSKANQETPAFPRLGHVYCRRQGENSELA